MAVTQIRSSTQINFDADVNVGTHKITNVVDPTTAQDAATKAYVDSVAEGLDPKASVACATTANISLTGEQTIDGVLTSTSRVLVKNQTAAEDNGIYVSAAGAWSRATDMDAWDEVPGAYVLSTGGTVNGDTGWVCTGNPGGVLGTTDIDWVQFFGVGANTAGTLIDITGTTISIAAGGDGQLIVTTGAGEPTYRTISGDVTISNTGVAAIAAGVIVNADISNSAAIAFGKLAALTSAYLLVGSAGNVATAVAVTGDVTISNTGVTAIASGVILNADINASAAIAFSKMESLAEAKIIVGSAGSVPTAVAVSGDVTINASGATAIGATKVTDAMLNDDVATGLAGAGMTATSGVLNVIAGVGIDVNANDVALDFVPFATPTPAADDVTTVFTIPTNTPATINGEQAIFVFVNGVFQSETDDYTAATNQITFVSAPATGDKIRVAYFK